MKYLIALTLLLTGCGPKQTIHDYCMDHIQSYSSYEECYGETAVNRQNQYNARQRAAENWAHAWDGMKNTQQKTTHCSPDFGGGYNCY